MSDWCRMTVSARWRIPQPICPVLLAARSANRRLWDRHPTIGRNALNHVGNGDQVSRSIPGAADSSRLTPLASANTYDILYMTVDASKRPPQYLSLSVVVEHLMLECQNGGPFVRA